MTERNRRGALTIDQVQARLRSAHAGIGREGRFALTLTLDGREDCYLTHWMRPEPHAFEDCKAIGSGTLADCLVALDRYVSGYRRPDDGGQAKAAGTPAADHHDPRILMAAE
ncbi:hypothetical protein [Azospirillum oleiclasticum]|uniref:hypothetical protein n=1 Tax=Azospirillum oleiclasticum TaxID=2735135 RepID=UPI001FE5F1C0|nr:hypothetical protein [Azospirillum oleiclasticum]